MYIKPQKTKKSSPHALLLSQSQKLELKHLAQKSIEPCRPELFVQIFRNRTRPLHREHTTSGLYFFNSGIQIKPFLFFLYNFFFVVIARIITVKPFF
jgi:hypothetical protein